MLARALGAGASTIEAMVVDLPLPVAPQIRNNPFLASGKLHSRKRHLDILRLWECQRGRRTAAPLREPPA